MASPRTLRLLNAEPEGYPSEALASLEACAEVDALALSRAELLARLTEYDGLLIRLGHRVDEELLQAAPRLRFVATPTTGLDHIDQEAAAQRGIAVLSLKGETAFLDGITATAELTWALLLALVRRLPSSVDHVRRGLWDRNQLIGTQLSGLTLGLVGYGRLGRIVAQYGAAFRMRVIACDPHARSVDPTIKMVGLDELVSSSDVVSVHVSLGPGTSDLIGGDVLRRTKPGACLINTSRGELIDEDALLRSLESGHLGGAALDVLAGEPARGPDWLSTHPLVAYARSHDNLLLTPHVGGATRESMSATEVFLARKIVAFIASSTPRSAGAQ